MKELAKIIVLLYSQTPKYYLDIVNIDNGEVPKKNYSKKDILTEIDTTEDIADWFSKLPLKEYQVNLYLRNGNNRMLKRSYYIKTENLNQEQPITAPTNQKEPNRYAGLKGGEVPQLLANEVLYDNLKIDFLELKAKYKKQKGLTEQQKSITEKIREKLRKTKTKLLFSDLNNNKKTFLETEVGQGLVGAIPQILESLAPVLASRGLNAAPEEVEKLTGQQKAFMEFIKTLSDKEIVEINTLYKQYLKEKKIVENQAQTSEETL